MLKQLHSTRLTCLKSWLEYSLLVFAFMKSLQMGVEGAERKGDSDENHGAEYFSIFMSTIVRRIMVPGAL